jgi:hypothetical protein
MSGFLTAEQLAAIPPIGTALTYEPQPASVVPLNRIVLIYAPELSSGWIRAIRKFPRGNRTATPRWKVLGAGCYGYMHGDFEPMAWLPIEAVS